MPSIYWLSQLFVVIAYIICGIAFLQKKQFKILILVTIFNLLMLIQFSLLGAIMGAIANGINISRNLLFIYNIKIKKENTKIVLYFFLLITIVLTFVFYSSPIDLFPCILALIGTYAYWSNNTKTVRICNLICSCCYIIYAIPIKSYFTIIAEAYLVLTTIIGYLKHERAS